VLVLLVLASIIITIGIWLGFWGAIELYAMLQSFILNWVLVITFAILGGILFGMFIGYRLVSADFTPFEKSMLEMFRTVEEMDRRLKRMETTMGIEMPPLNEAVEKNPEFSEKETENKEG